MSNGHSIPPTKIELVDYGRGMQLSTSRITVQDLAPYFLRNCSHDEIQRWMPTLSIDEIKVVEAYFLEHREEIAEKEIRYQAYVEEQMALQRIRFPEEGRRERLEEFRKLIRKQQEGSNGAGTAG